MLLDHRSDGVENLGATFVGGKGSCTGHVGIL
jgi:hypothetical protein